jgi:hypothetical protein
MSEPLKDGLAAKKLMTYSKRHSAHDEITKKIFEKERIKRFLTFFLTIFVQMTVELNTFY